MHMRAHAGAATGEEIGVSFRARIKYGRMVSAVKKHPTVGHVWAHPGAFCFIVELHNRRSD
jgi:hypothetical protein